MKIRQFSKKDFRPLVRLIDNIFDKEDSLAAKQDIVFEVELKKDRIKDDWLYWVAEFNKKPVGFIGIVDSKAGSPWISWFGVGKSHRNKGIGKKLLEHVIKEAKKRGARRLLVEGSTLPMFRRANAIYKKFDFQEKFRIKDWWRKGDHLIVMCKKL